MGSIQPRGRGMGDGFPASRPTSVPNPAEGAQVRPGSGHTSVALRPRSAAIPREHRPARCSPAAGEDLVDDRQIPDDEREEPEAHPRLADGDRPRYGPPQGKRIRQRNYEMLRSGKSLEVHCINVTPFPVSAGLERLHDRVVALVKVVRGVLVLGAIAAADVAARQPEAKLHPPLAQLHTLLAALCTRRHLADLIQMGAGDCHVLLLPGCRAARFTVLEWGHPSSSLKRQHHSSSCRNSAPARVGELVPLSGGECPGWQRAAGPRGRPHATGDSILATPVTGSTLISP